MPKFFVVSDIHGYYDELIKTLKDVGFNPENENHWLISCGDIWDRGPKPYQVMKFLNGLPRKVLILGNHEELFQECCIEKPMIPNMRDISNGTVDTIRELGKIYEWENEFSELCRTAQLRTDNFLNGFVDYYETENYIFVHSWIPLKCNDNLPPHDLNNRSFEYNPDWREASLKDWKTARWGNPFDLAQKGFNQTGKTIVFGHWHSSYGWSKEYDISEFGSDAIFTPYVGKGYIGVDCCTAHSGVVGCVIIEDNFLESEKCL